MATATAQTTFQRYQGTRVRNYCTRPTIDVPILEPARVCRTCTKPVHYDPKAETFGATVHTDGTNDHRAYGRLTCTYCGCDDPAQVAHHQEAYANVTRCTRCGGADGFAIGD